MTNVQKPVAPENSFSANRLIGVDDLSDAEIYYLLNLADYYAGFVSRSKAPPQVLIGKTQINLFFEDSTRTNLSFELAGKKLGADVINVPVAASSLHKGESLVDTARTLAAMGAQIMVVRAKEEGLHTQLSQILDCAIINGGAGALEHPTQALLDAATVTIEVGPLRDKTIAICGDIKHSRVASSDALLFTRLGANVRFVGPAELMPAKEQFPNIEQHDKLTVGLENADIIMGLRMQFERMADADNAREASNDYFDKYGLTHETIKFAKPTVKVMHPGPMNRGVEIDGALADDRAVSLIEKQVFYGVALRMAVLDALAVSQS